MGFIRRISLSTADNEDARPRNRLTKPMTRKVSPTQRSASVRKSPTSRSGNTSLTSSQLSLAGTTRRSSKRESRLQSKLALFETITEIKPLPVTKSSPARKGVASLVAQFESAASTSQLSLGPPVPPKPSNYVSNPVAHRTSGLLKQQKSLSNIRSKEHLSVHKSSVSTLASAAASTEYLVDPFAIPRRRESSYRPGEATRKPSVESGKKEEELSSTDELENHLSLEEKVAIEAREEYFTPPPPVTRAETPSNLDFKAIGGLRLGSLRVVNGRSSPVLSELSRHLISRQLRDVSSEYADSIYSKDQASEAWEDADLVSELDEELEDVDDAGPQTPMKSTFELDTRQFSTPLGQVHDSDPLTPAPRTPCSNDKTSMMAEAYRNELQGSPFSFGSSPVSTGSVVRRPDEEQDNDQSRETPEPEVETRCQSLQSEQPSIESHPSAASTFSPRDMFTSALEFQAPAFEPPPSPERGISPSSLHSDAVSRLSARADSGYNSGTSTFSVHLKQPNTTNDEEPLPVPTVPNKQEPVSQTAMSRAVPPKKEASPRKFGKFFPFRHTPRKSTDTAPAVPTLVTVAACHSITADPVLASATVASQVEPMKPITPKSEVPRRKPVPVRQEEHVKVLARPNADKPLPAPVIVKANHSPKKSKPVKEEKSPKTQNKLHKLRPQSQTRGPKEIVVQRLASCESTLDIPNISEVARSNLQVRSEQVPELERTFRSQDHIKSQPSMSTLALPILDIRFPSPMPDLDYGERQHQDTKKERGRSRSRSRSKSRRRSFLDMFRSDKTVAKREIDQASKSDTDLAMSDFGDVLTSLGANPYAIAHSRSHSPNAAHAAGTSSRTSLDPAAEEKQKRRVSMTDEQASEFARQRSHSFHGRDNSSDRRQVIADNGLVLGKYLRTSVVEGDVPPLPPLPDGEQLRKISQRLSLQSSSFNTPTQMRKFWEDSPSSNNQFGSSPAPPLPLSHSNSPLSNHMYDEGYTVDDEIEDEIAPPPPCHSPAPNDIHPRRTTSASPQPNDEEFEDDSQTRWDKQAQVWRERRKSANEALKSQRQSFDTRYNYEHDNQGWNTNDVQEQTCPVLPVRHPGRHEIKNHDHTQWGTSAYTQPNSFEYPLNGHDGPAWNDSTYPPEEEEFKYSRSSFQSRRRRDHTWDDSQRHRSSDIVSHRSYEDGYANDRQVPDSRLSGGMSDQVYSTPRASPARGRQARQEDYEYGGVNGYEQHYPQNYGHVSRSQQRTGYNSPSSKRPISQQFPYYQPSPSQSRSRHGSPNPGRGQPLVSSSPGQSRPSSQQVTRSRGTSARARDRVQSELDVHPYTMSNVGRYSGGLKHGYE